MNQIFSLSRFGKLVMSHWAEYKKRYALFALAMFGIMLFGTICLLAFDSYRSFDEDMQYALFHFALFTAACIFSGTFLSNLNDKSKGITYIMLPASAFEKLLCTILFTIPLFFTVYVIAFYIIDIPFVAIANSIKYQEYLKHPATVNINSNINTPFRPYHVISIFYNVKGNGGRNYMDDYKFFQQMFYAVFALQAFFLMGSAYFKKFAFVKTILAGFLIMMFYSLFTFLVFKDVSGDGRLLDNYFSEHPVKDIYYLFTTAFVWFFKLGLGLSFYLITYFHIKEKEI